MIKTQTPEIRNQRIAWNNILILAIIHIFGLQGLYYIIFHQKIILFLFGYFVGMLTGLGITAGAHRLWSHRTYKAKLPLRILLCIFNCMALQTSIYEWSRDHRLHHRMTDTNADPHNSKRGFFFSHVGWLMLKKHPDVIRIGKETDMSDLEADPVVMFQKRYHAILSPPLSLLLPAIIPWCLWNESFYVSWTVVCAFRYLLSLHATWSVNSVAHIWGDRPYDRNIRPAQNLSVAIASMGEGWHNFHHVFPWDYKTGEFGSYGTNWTTAFIDFMAKIGWAYDLKVATDDLVQKRMVRTGDGTGVTDGLTY